MIDETYVVFTRLAQSALAVALVMAFCGVVAPSAAVAQDSSTPLPFKLSIQGANGQAEVRVPMPEGAVPKQLVGTLTSTYSLPGVIVLSASGRPAAEFNPLVGGAVTADLRPEDVVDGAILLRMAVRLADQEQCFADDNAIATLADARVTYSTPAQEPTTIGSFLSQGVETYTVAVSPTADPLAQTAALDAVGALTARYHPPTAVTLEVTDQPPAGNYADRVVIIDSSFPGPGVRNRITAEGFALTITGQGESLSEAAVALADSNTDVLAAATVTNLLGLPQYRQLPTTSTLSDLGNSDVSIAGVGRTSAELSVNQPTLGYQVSDIDIDLAGAVTALPEGGQGRVDFLWNNQLLTSREMSAVTKLQQQLSIPAELVRRENTLTVQLNYVPPGGECFPPGLSARVDVNAELSTVSVTPGEALAPGFGRFPQAFDAEVPVVVGTATSPSASLAQAAQLVASLQSLSPQQYRYRVSSGDAPPDGRAALLVGQAGTSAKALGAPLTDDTAVIDVAGESFSAQFPETYAALQAFEHDGNDLVLLSTSPGSTPEADGLTVSLADYANAQPEGWRALTGQVVALPAGGQPTEVAVQQPEPADKGRTMLVAALIGLVAVALLVALWLWRRPRGEAPPPPGQLSTTPAGDSAPGVEP